MSLLTKSKSRAYLAALAALAGLAVATLGAGPAGASSSGGVSTQSSGGTSGGDGASAPVNERYTKIWFGQVRPAERRWAHRTAECESGGNPRAIGGGGVYRGAFQFMRSTWKAAPKSPGGDPVAYPYRTQAVVAVLLKRQAGTSPWPNCGR